MSQQEYENLLKVASDQIPCGVYAIEKGGKAELRRDKCNSKGKLKEVIRYWKTKGYKVYANRGDD